MPLNIVADFQRLLARNEPFGRAVVTRIWGSAPRPEGATMFATASGAILGSVSGGCVEGATATEIREAIARGTPALVSYGVSDDDAWAVGLSCGGTIDVFVEPAVRQELLDAAGGPGGVVLATVIEAPTALGASLVVRDDALLLPPLAPPGADEAATREAITLLQLVAKEVEAAARAALAAERSRTVGLTAPDGRALTVFLEVFPRHPKLVIFGGAHVAQALCHLARSFDYHTCVADGRAAFLTRERFPDADELILGWPEEVFQRVGLDRSTYVVLLSHDPKFDEPAMELALRSDAPYVGAIGSRTTQQKRRERLRAAGFSDAELARLRGPIGLDLGGRQPMETALAILAEITAVRFGGTGGALTREGG